MAIPAGGDRDRPRRLRDLARASALTLAAPRQARGRLHADRHGRRSPRATRRTARATRYIWGAPFAFAAGAPRRDRALRRSRRSSIAAAFAFQAAHVDDPVPFSAVRVVVADRGRLGRLRRRSSPASSCRSWSARSAELDDGFEQGILGMAFLDLAGRWTSASTRAGARCSAARPRSCSARTFSEVTHPDDQAVSPRRSSSHVVEQGTAVFDKRYVRPDGIDALGQRPRDDPARRRRHADRDLRRARGHHRPARAPSRRSGESETRFERTFEDAGVGMLILRARRDGPAANGAAAALFGAAPDEIKGTRIVRLAAPGGARGRAGGGEPRCSPTACPDTFERDVRYIRSDGHVVHTSATAALVRDDEGRPAYTIVQLVDMSDAADRAAPRGRAGRRSGSLGLDDRVDRARC